MKSDNEHNSEKCHFHCRCAAQINVIDSTGEINVHASALTSSRHVCAARAQECTEGHRAALRRPAQRRNVQIKETSRKLPLHDACNAGSIRLATTSSSSPPSAVITTGGQAVEAYMRHDSCTRACVRVCERRMLLHYL